MCFQTLQQIDQVFFLLFRSLEERIRSDFGEECVEEVLHTKVLKYQFLIIAFSQFEI